MVSNQFNFRPAKSLIFFYAILIAISGICILSLPWIWELKSLLILMAGLYGFYLLRFAFLQTKHSILSLHCDSTGQWFIQTKIDKYPADLCGSSTVTTLISVLRFKIPARYGKLSCIVTNDSLPKNVYRELIVLVKMG